MDGSTNMKIVLHKAQRSEPFPAATVSDGSCWQTTVLSGQHEKDYVSLTKNCGTPTGSKEYVEPMHGNLDHGAHKADSFGLKLHKGFCYRYFAVADPTIKDLDIIVMKPDGALVADDQTTQPVAIVEPSKPWCMDDDQIYKIKIVNDSQGDGGYVFGIWARPKK